MIKKLRCCVLDLLLRSRWLMTRLNSDYLLLRKMTYTLWPSFSKLMHLPFSLALVAVKLVFLEADYLQVPISVAFLQCI